MDNGEEPILLSLLRGGGARANKTCRASAEKRDPPWTQEVSEKLNGPLREIKIHFLDSPLAWIGASLARAKSPGSSTLHARQR